MSTEPQPTGVPASRFALPVLCAAFFIGVLDSTSVFAALPSIGQSLDLRATELAWVVTTYGVVVAGLMLPLGRMADVIGRRRVFMAAVLVFALGSLACGLAASGAMLIVARGVQGVGAAALTPSALALLLSIYHEAPARNRALGIWGGLGGVGATAGLLLGGLITDTLGWPWIFYLNVPVCVVVLALTPRMVPESRQAQSRRFDLPGGLLLSGTLMLLVFALLEAPSAGGSVPVLLSVAGAVALAVTLVLVERRTADPILPARLFRASAVVRGNTVVLASGIAVDGLLALTTVYAQQMLGLPAIVFGLALGVMTGMSVVAVGLGQKFVTRRGIRPVAVAGLVLLSATCVAFTLLPPEPGGLLVLVPGLVAFGTGMGAAFVAGQIAAVSGVHPDDVGAASGLEETVFTVGGVTGVALVTAISLWFTHGRPNAGGQLDGLHAGFAALAAITVAASIIALRLPGRPRMEAAQPR